MEGPWNGAKGDNKYQYNGKELNDDFGLGWIDFGFRSYDPSVGRWWVQEPLLDFYPEISPYVYANNNPVLIIDIMGFKADTVKPAPGGIIPDWNNFDPSKDEALLPEAEVTDTKPNKNEEKKEEPPASGVSESSAARYVPVLGSGLDAYDAYSRGDYWKATGHALLAASDVFLVKSLVTGIGKAIWRKGLVEGSTKYFGFGMSHSYGATVSRLRGLGVDMTGYKHHWFIKQSLMNSFPILRPLGNQAWNLTKFGTQSSHMRWAHGQSYLGTEAPFLWQLWLPISSTPQWLKLGIYPRVLGEYLNGDD